MRILLVNETGLPHTGGRNRLVVELTDWLQKAGHHVALAYHDGAAHAVRCPTYPFPARVSPAELQTAFKKILAAFQPEVMQFHWWDASCLRSAVSRLAPSSLFLHDQSFFCSGGDRMDSHYHPCHRPHGIHCLFWHYAQRCGGKNPFGNWRRWQQVSRQQWVPRDPEIRIQVASEFMRQGLLENGYAAGRIDVIPLGAGPPKTNAQSETGLLLVACRLVRSKGIDCLLQALPALSDRPWKLAVAGEGPQRKALQALSERLNLAAKVRFLGELSPGDLEEWFDRAEMVISPTLRPEPFGLVGLEAMAHGKPVIAFAGGATEEWLVDGQTGLIVRERSPAALSQAIGALLRNPDQRRALGAAARRRWEQYAPDLFVARLCVSFEKCICEFAQAKHGLKG